MTFGSATTHPSSTATSGGPPQAPQRGGTPAAAARIPHSPSGHASSCSCSKLLPQQRIFHTQRPAASRRFTDTRFCLQSAATDSNLGMEQEVRFQNSTINPPGGGNETRISSLRSSLQADGDVEPAPLSKPRCVCGPETPCPAFQLFQDRFSCGPL